MWLHRNVKTSPKKSPMLEKRLEFQKLNSDIDWQNRYKVNKLSSSEKNARATPSLQIQVLI